MDDKHSADSSNMPPPSHAIARSDSSDSSSTEDDDHETPHIHAPVPTRPRLPSRQSSGPLVVPRDSSAVGPVDKKFGPDDARAMSPRRTSEDIEALGREAREELRRCANPPASC
jgi:short coiled-coil protein